jgi:iron(III) transport system substrate-binding protein
MHNNTPYQFHLWRYLMNFLKLTLLAALTASPAFAQTLTIYTNREPALIKAVTDAFTKETGIAVETLFITNGLLERLETEGAATKADLVYVTDVTLAEQAKTRALTKAFDKDVTTGINPLYVDPALQWVGLGLRTRVIFASRERVKETNLTYDELADPRFKGKICIRQGAHPYNLALISAAITNMKLEGATAWLTGLKANLARKAAGGDRDVARDILAGVCDLGVANNYYLGLMMNDTVQSKWAEAVKLINPTFKGGGTHINLAAAFIPKEAKNQRDAEKFLNYALTQKSQAAISLANFEFPVRDNTPLEEPLKSWNNFTPDKVKPAEMAANRKAASDLVDSIGFDK